MSNLEVSKLLANREGKMVILEMGCGARKRHSDAIGIDALYYEGVDVVGDIFSVLRKFPARSVDMVYSYHFVEHIPDVFHLLEELARVVKQAGVVNFVAPHFSNPYFYSDPTHKSFFGLYTFDYLSTHTPHRRKVPTYQKNLNFELLETHLVFKDSVSFPLSYGVKKVIGLIFDSCNFMREFHERWFCYLLPSYEVVYRLRRNETGL